MKKFITTTVALVTTLSLALLLGTGPVASSGCNPVNGHLVEDLVPGPGFQTAGRFWGAIQAPTSSRSPVPARPVIRPSQRSCTSWVTAQFARGPATYASPRQGRSTRPVLATTPT